jgi:predicted peroxiredoxin
MRLIVTAAAVSLVLLATLGCCEYDQESSTVPIEPPRDGVFIHVSSGADDPHRVLMALRMAELMAADRDVLVYFDIKGIEVVLAAAEDLVFPDFPPSKVQLETLRDLGVGLFACPGCLAAAGRTADDLAQGIQVANQDAFFDFTEGRILTLDY